MFLSILKSIKTIAKNKPQTIAICDQENLRKTTYDELESFSNQIANKLSLNNFKKGVRIMILMEESFEYVATMLAI